MIWLLRGRYLLTFWVLGILQALHSGQTFFLLSLFLDSPAPSSLSELRMLLLFCWTGFRVHSVYCFYRSAHSPWARSVLLPCLTQAPLALHPNLVSPWLSAC